MRLQKMKIKKYMEVIQKVAGKVNSPNKHLERISFAMERARKSNDSELEKSIRLFSPENDHNCKSIYSYF
jgi:hypothetical protein